MFITTDPWIVLTLKGKVHGAISQVIGGETFFQISGGKCDNGIDYYSPLSKESMPSAEDSNDFAQVFHILSKLVAEGVLSGPHGENHPATDSDFYYVSPTTSAQTLLVLLQERGVEIHIKTVHYTYSPATLAKIGDARIAEIQGVLREKYGEWMTAETKFEIPSSDEEKHEKRIAEWEDVKRQRAEYEARPLIQKIAISTGELCLALYVLIKDFNHIFRGRGRL